MNIKINTIKVSALFLGLAALWSCSSDFIERPPEDRYVDANFFKTDDQVLASTAPLYARTWFGYTDKASFPIGDGRAGNYRGGWQNYVRNVTEATEPELRATWSAFFNTVAHCNAVVRNIEAYAGPEVTEGIRNHGLAEARFMRAMAYMYLVRLWGPVPIIEDNTKSLTSTNIRTNTIASVYQFIVRDFEFAAANLPPTPLQTGRITSWSAKGMLAKTYLFMASYHSSGGNRDQDYLDLAKDYAEDVCKNSGLALLEDYWQLFRSQNDNNEEALVSLQWVWNSSYGGGNPLPSQFAYSSDITGFDDGWGGWQGATSDLVKYYIANQRDSIRRKATLFFDNDYYNYMHMRKFDDNGNATFVPLQFEAIQNRSQAPIKKYMPGPPIDNDGKGARQSTDNNTYLLRLADVYLDYVEAILGNNGSTTDADALLYFNAIRERAGMPEVNSITEASLLQEKRIEFAMEHHYWYELLKWYYRDPEAMKAYVGDQDRGDPQVSYVPNTNPKQWTATYPNVEKYPLTDQKLYLPLPAADAAAMPSLTMDPIDYEF
ncbi:RagB/SusD family nutrient uptake outer membrane protein [Pseudochryseolinea flava]|nr:RagB/SusD family nutrient uptake outer membrane protein [Pseudochryseolinea flava]